MQMEEIGGEASMINRNWTVRAKPVLSCHSVAAQVVRRYSARARPGAGQSSTFTASRHSTKYLRMTIRCELPH